MGKQSNLIFVTTLEYQNPQRGVNQMKPNLLLTVSAIYLAVIGIGLLFEPDMMLFGALGSTAPAIVLASVRGYGAALLGIGVVHEVARNTSASPLKDAIFVAGTIGYLLVAITQVSGIVNGAPQFNWVFAIIDLLFAIAFFLVRRANMQTKV
jgi:hypothetical protein